MLNAIREPPPAFGRPTAAARLDMKIARAILAAHVCSSRC